MDDELIQKLIDLCAAGKRKDLSMLCGTVCVDPNKDEDDEISKAANIPANVLRVRGLVASYGKVDSDGDMFAQGAFKKSIEYLKRAKKGKIAMFYNHDFYRGDSLPLGVFYNLTDTKAGPVMRGYINRDGGMGGRNEAVAQSVLDGALTDFSITAQITERDTIDGTRIIKEAMLREVSIVWWGAQENARIKVGNNSSAKSSAEDNGDFYANMRDSIQRATETSVN